MTEKLTSWDPAEYMQTPEDMAHYLEAVIEEAGGDAAMIASALGDIARARNMSKLAEETGITRQGLYKALSGEGKPTFETIVKVTHALGMEFKFTATA